MEITYKHLSMRVNNPKIAMIPKGIILHYTANPRSTALQNANYFANVNDKISVHYIVDDNYVVEIIPPIHKSYGTSKGEYNNSYIQIEMCHPDDTGKISAKTLDNVVWLCRELMYKYNIKGNIIRHYDATGKNCPKYYVEHPSEWVKLVERIKKGSETMAELTTAKSAIEYLASKGVLNSPDYWLKVADCVKYFDQLVINIAKKI